MAYLDLSVAAQAGSSLAGPKAHSQPLAIVDVVQTFSDLERRVLDLARGEGLTSLRAPRKRSWLARLILGPTPPSRILANERLEALRRLAVHAWHYGYTLPASALRDAKQAGYSESQVGWVVDFVGRSRTQVRRVGR